MAGSKLRPWQTVSYRSLRGRPLATPLNRFSTCSFFPSGSPRPFDGRGAGGEGGFKRNYQLLAPLDFLAEFTQHIPPKGAHLIRYYGWYSNKARGMRRKAAEAAAADNLPSPSGRGAGGEGSSLPSPGTVRSMVGRRAVGEGITRRCSPTWAMLIKRVYEVDPLACPKCGGPMKVVAFIEPPQGDVIEKILRHCDLWHPSVPRPPPAGLSQFSSDRAPTEGWSGTVPLGCPGELVYVPNPDWDSQTASSDEPWEVGYPLAGRDAYGDPFDASF